MKIIVGLGNPGSKYKDTKHNIGFITLDEVANQNGINFNKSKFESEIAEFNFSGEKVLLVKPQTFMNESGRAIRPLLDYYNLTEEDILVIYDDLDLPTGKIRLRQKGSAGGHNGIKSLIRHIGTQDFNRIKIGIDRPQPGKEVVSHVLGTFPKETHEEMLLAVKNSADAVADWISNDDFVSTMNKFNSK
ncbi:aminoacyl-tRNA hydrolase [Vagococcus coleopterorum]|uniref:Peptidyl-tRNA hydrolase n=1 Tax=Vagococcus coleopterorum TaxID=2714946 RepID=A0A6G8ALT4_9ENTE|nr:aminoacyl-tRNA hydrolase [Vagococcus coleopterorum]QIL46044.1 aminoacyl-tRNA hydrolase [Vagococcus coleopterorum]